MAKLDAIIKAIPGRVLLGRPAQAKMHVGDADDLVDVCSRMTTAYTGRGFKDLPVHIIVLRHDLRWAEQMVRVPAEILEAEDPPVAMATALLPILELMKGLNSAELWPGADRDRPGGFDGPTGAD